MFWRDRLMPRRPQIIEHKQIPKKRNYDRLLSEWPKSPQRVCCQGAAHRMLSYVQKIIIDGEVLDR